MENDYKIQDLKIAYIEKDGIKEVQYIYMTTNDGTNVATHYITRRRLIELNQDITSYVDGLYSRYSDIISEYNLNKRRDIIALREALIPRKAQRTKSSASRTKKEEKPVVVAEGEKPAVIEKKEEVEELVPTTIEDPIERLESAEETSADAVGPVIGTIEEESKKGEDVDLSTKKDDESSLPAYDPKDPFHEKLVPEKPTTTATAVKPAPMPEKPKFKITFKKIVAGLITLALLVAAGMKIHKDNQYNNRIANFDNTKESIEGTLEPEITSMPVEAVKTPMPTMKPTTRPTATPMPTMKPTTRPTATPMPTMKPTTRPTATPMPTMKPTARPTATPMPTMKPTARPTVTPMPTEKPALVLSFDVTNESELEAQVAIIHDAVDSLNGDFFEKGYINDDIIKANLLILNHQYDLLTKYGFNESKRYYTSSLPPIIDYEPRILARYQDNPENPKPTGKPQATNWAELFLADSRDRDAVQPFVDNLNQIIVTGFSGYGEAYEVALENANTYTLDELDIVTHGNRIDHVDIPSLDRVGDAEYLGVFAAMSATTGMLSDNTTTITAPREYNGYTSDEIMDLLNNKLANISGIEFVDYPVERQPDGDCDKEPYHK